MRIVHKLLLATLVPAVLIWTVGNYATNASQRSLREAIESGSLTRASSVMDEIDRILQTRTANWKAYSRSDLVQETLMDSNAEFADLEDAEEIIDERERLWRAAPAGQPNPLMNGLRKIRLARDLRRRLAKLEEGAGYPVYGEVFLTNRFGANAAQTGRTSDYRQDDEIWWQMAARNGVYIGDAVFDESAGIPSIDICLRIDDAAGEMLGVMKAVMNIREVFSVIDSRSERYGPSDRLILLTQLGQIIRIGNEESEYLADGSFFLNDLDLSDAAPEAITYRTDPAHGQRNLYASALSQGFSDFEGLGWVVVDERREALTFAPITRLRQQIIWISLLATLLALAVGGLIAWSLTRRIGRLSIATIAIGQGRLDTQVNIGGKDEVGRLATRFNRMATDLKQASNDLTVARDEAQAANRSKSAFLANMSHEIRTPMNGIIGMGEVLSHSELSPEQTDQLNMIRESADALLRLLNDILDFSKIEAGKLELESIPFDLRDCVDATGRTLSVRAVEKGLELAFRIEPELPNRLQGDPGRLKQVLMNLAGNAIKFTENGEVVVDVTQEAVENDRIQLHFVVKDTGIGIAKDKQAVVFESFSQEDLSTTRKFGGTGLGLAISSQLVEMMDGKIWVVSEPGQGSEFHFTATFQIVSGEAESVQREVSSLADRRVLIVDDNATNQQIYVELLRSWSSEPVAVSSAFEALTELTRAAASDASFDSVILDYMMPEMDGFEFAQRVRQDSQLESIPIIMLSSEGEVRHTRRCKELGNLRYLTKPVLGPTYSMLCLILCNPIPRPPNSRTKTAMQSW